jgi:precorrin-6A/cobalt-precorrin-6A reductase
MPSKRILVLGGTTEAREAADALQALGHHVVFSLAGVTAEPLLPNTNIRRGGFGGVDGLVTYLRAEKTDAILDATHPFAVVMSRQAHDASHLVGVHLARLERPAWTPSNNQPWISAFSIPEAAMMLPTGARVLITTGRKDLAPFLSRHDLSGLIRTIEKPDAVLPDHWRLLQDRPPFHVEGECKLLQDNAITHLVSKNAGSHATAAKLEAARNCGVSIVMIERPFKPDCKVFSDVSTLKQHVSEWLGISNT